VTDIGGALGHGAIVAREVGIPCVVNTEIGSRTLRTGDEIEIDGSTGHIEIIARAKHESGGR
jgi:pyruvate,water dikinase